MASRYIEQESTLVKLDLTDLEPNALDLSFVLYLIGEQGVNLLMQMNEEALQQLLPLPSPHSKMVARKIAPTFVLTEINGNPELEFQVANIESAFASWFNQQYGINHGTHKEFLQNIFTLVEATHQYLVQKLFPLQRGLYSGLNNISTVAAEPLLLAKYLSARSDPTLRHETRLKLMIADTIARLRIWEAEAAPPMILSKLQEIFEFAIFDGLEGNTTLKVIYSVHDALNNVIAWSENKSEVELQLREGCHIKRIPIRARKLKGSEDSELLVMMDIRTKPLASQVAKAFLKALKSDGVIEYERVSDIMGIQFVVIGDDNKRDEFEAVLLNAIAFGKEVGIFSKYRIEDDDVADGSATSSQHRMRRIQVYLNDLALPVEIILKSIPEHLNSQFSTGSFDEKKGFWNGNAHDLFSMYRLFQLVDTFFPEEYYSFVGEKTPREHALAHAESEVARLRAAFRIE